MPAPSLGSAAAQKEVTMRKIMASGLAAITLGGAVAATAAPAL